MIKHIPGLFLGYIALFDGLELILGQVREGVQLLEEGRLAFVKQLVLRIDLFYEGSSTHWKLLRYTRRK
jgi:hypothetical protein